MRFLSALLAFCTLCSCSEHPTILSALDRAKSMMIEQPDSALSILRSMNENRIRKASTRANYALLYSQALDKNEIDVKDDSLIRIAARYFKKRGTVREQFQAQYYLGRVQQNAEDYQAALQSFLNAEELLPKVDDDYLAGLLYFSIAELNSVQNSYERALHYYKKSYESYMCGEKHKHRINTLASIAKTYLLQREYSNAIDTYKTALGLAAQMGYADLETCCIQSLIGVYVDLQDIPVAKKYMGSLLKRKNDFDYHDYCTFAQLYLYDGKPDSTEYYALKMLEVQDNDQYRILAAKTLLADAAFEKKHYDRAYNLCLEYQQQKDSLFLTHMNSSVAEAELQYKDERLAYEHYRLTIKQKAIYATVLISLLALAGIVYLYQKKVRRQHKQLAEYFSMIDNMTAPKTIQSSWLDALFNARFQILKELARTYYEYGNSATLVKKVKVILSEKIVDASMLEDLENTLNQRYDNVIHNFRAEYPKSNEDFIELLCLLYAGFSPQEICVITDETLSAIYMRKSRLKKKIATSTLPNKEEILRILS